MKSRKPVMSYEEEEAEEDALFEAEEARMKAAQLQKELEEQNKFDCLCDGVLNSLSLVDSAFSEILELKDELLQHDLPPSLLVAVTLATGKMFRSITDLHTPIQELTRLVNIYSVPWEQRSEALKKLHNDYESKQRQLNIAIRKLQLVDARTRRLDKEKKIMNWERAFAKVTSTKTHGRRWKFMIEAFKKKAKNGISLSDLDVELSDDESDQDQDDVDVDNDDGVAEKQRFMLSVIAASPPDDEEGTPQAGSDIESEADGIPSEISDSTGHVEESSPDLKQRRRGVSFVPEEEGEQEERVKIVKEEKPPCEERGVWTDEPEYDTHLAIRLFRPVQLKDDDGSDTSCTISFGGNNKKTSVLPLAIMTSQSVSEEHAVPIDEAEVGEAKIQTKLKGKGRRKSIGFASRPSSPPAMSSPSKSMFKSKPSSILKKVKPSDDDSIASDPEKIDRTKYEQVVFEPKEDVTDGIRIALHQGEQGKMVAMATITWEDLQEKEFAVKYDSANEEGETNEEDNSSLDDELSTQEMLNLSLHGIKLGIGGHSPGVIGQLPLLCYWIKKEKPRRVSVEVNTDGVRELIKEVTGVDINDVTKEELTHMLGREYNDVSTSAMSFVSSSSHKSGYIPLEELDSIREQHDVELKNIQDDYEVKVQELLSEIEKLQNTQHEQVVVTRRRGGDVTFADVEHLPKHTTMPDIPRPPSGGSRPLSGSHWRAPKIPQLPDWGAHLPKNVWDRMRMLTEEMMMKRRQLDLRIRQQIALNIEKKLASQYKLQRNESTIHGPLQDVSLPALFMPSKSGNVYNPRARLYFHPTGTTGDLRLTQPPSIFQLPPLPEKARMSVVNLFELSKNFEQPAASEWLNRMASAPSRGSRATTAGSRMAPHTPAPTANIQPSDVYS